MQALSRRTRGCLVLLAALHGTLSCDAAQPASNAAMAALLARCAEVARADPGPYDNRATAERYLARERAGKLRSAPGLLAAGKSLLAAGRPAEALERLSRARALGGRPGSELPPGFPLDVRRSQVLAWLRLGEKLNQDPSIGAEAWAFPLRGRAVHRHAEPDLKAIEELLSLLGDDPGDITARWLLNLAQMAAGASPVKVPARWALPAASLESPRRLPRFEDVGPRLGIARRGHAGGCVLDDFDGDGDVDLMVSSKGLDEQLRFYRNRGDGTFAEDTEAAGLTGLTGGIDLVQADYDNDGRLDVLVLRGGRGRPQLHPPNSLLRGEPGGRFREVTREAGLLDIAPASAGAFGDYDGDGRLDLFLGNELSCPAHAAALLLHGEKDGTFSRTADLVWPESAAYVRGACWADFDNDGRPDLYVSRFGAGNLLFRNKGPVSGGAWSFEEAGRAAGVEEPIYSIACAAFDYDNDGWRDLLVVSHGPAVSADQWRASPDAIEQKMLRLDDNAMWAGIAEPLKPYFGQAGSSDTMRLYRNNRDGTFASAGPSMGLTMPVGGNSVNFGDLDGDGWTDFYVGTGGPGYATILPDLLYLNEGGRRFVEAATGAGMAGLQKGFGVAFADVEGDGDLDVYAVRGGLLEGDDALSACFANPLGPGRWLELRLEGSRSNRSALGARIRVRLATPAGPRDLHGTVTSGGSFGASPLAQHFGLGDATAIESVEIRWPIPTGNIQEMKGLAIGRRYRVREGETTALPASR